MKKTLAIWKKVHGDEHPSVATGLNNLASLYQDQASSALILAEPHSACCLSVRISRVAERLTVLLMGV